MFSRTNITNGIFLKDGNILVDWKWNSIAGMVGGVPMDIYYGIKQSIYTPIRNFIFGW